MVKIITRRVFGKEENGNSQLINPPDEPAGFRIKIRYPPVVRNINLENITGKKSAYALLLNGYEHSPITELSITLLTRLRRKPCLRAETHYGVQARV
jgi:hypothetical protein